MRRQSDQQASQSQASAIPEAELVEDDTKLFSVRRPFALMRKSSGEDVPGSTKPPGILRRSSFSFTPTSQSMPPPKPLFVPPRPDAPNVTPIGKAAHKLFSAGLNMIHGLDSSGSTKGPLSYGTAYTTGRRPYMEDRHVTRTGLLNNTHIFGVFDGHGGDAAAEYCVDNIAAQIKARFAHESEISDTELVNSLTVAFTKVDADFSKFASARRMDDGTTAVVLLIRRDQLICANAGDSRCVLSRQAQAFEMSKDHKPNRPDERERITSLGGFVRHLGVWRTQGVLAVSRAIGDVSLKPYVIPTPEIITTQLVSGDQFAVLASDGLWDVMENQEVVDYLHSRPKLLAKPEQGARALVAEAFKRGSLDNVTVVVVVFDISLRESPTPSARMNSELVPCREADEEEGGIEVF